MKLFIFSVVLSNLLVCSNSFANGEYKEVGPITTYSFDTDGSNYEVVVQKPARSYVRHLKTLTITGSVVSDIRSKLKTSVFSGDRKYGKVSYEEGTEKLALLSSIKFNGRSFRTDVASVVCSLDQCVLNALSPEDLTNGEGHTWWSDSYQKESAKIVFDNAGIEDLLSDVGICEKEFFNGGTYGANGMCFMELN